MQALKLDLHIIEKLIDDIGERYRHEALELNNFLADNPEISGEEYNSSKAIATLLEKHNMNVTMPFAGHDTAFIAKINEGKKRKAAILVEYDALKGMGHACGHCASGSISALAGIILNELKDKIDAQIDIIGTPDEEYTGKKVNMVQDGVFDEYDFAIMIHLNNKSAVSARILALDAFTVEFFGKSSHAAQSPWKGRNALNAVRLLFDSVDMMRQHVTNDVKIHGIIEQGGLASNIVPDYAKAEFCTRATSRANLEDVTAWVEECAKGAAMATRTEVKVERLGMPFDDLITNQTGEDLLEKIYKDLGIVLDGSKYDELGSTDIGNVSYRCPSFHPLLGIGGTNALHTKEFAEAMKCESISETILNGAKIISRFVFNVYNDEEILLGIKNDFNKKLEENKLIVSNC